MLDVKRTGTSNCMRIAFDELVQCLLRERLRATEEARGIALSIGPVDERCLLSKMQQEPEFEAGVGDGDSNPVV